MLEVCWFDPFAIMTDLKVNRENYSLFIRQTCETGMVDEAGWSLSVQTTPDGEWEELGNGDDLVTDELVHKARNESSKISLYLVDCHLGEINLAKYMNQVVTIKLNIVPHSQGSWK